MISKRYSVGFPLSAITLYLEILSVRLNRLGISVGSDTSLVFFFKFFVKVTRTIGSNFLKQYLF